MEKLNFRVSDKKKCVEINMSSSDDIATIAPITIIELFDSVVKKFPEHPALKHKNHITKDWETYTYLEYKERVEKMAKVFIRLGLERHGTVAILAFNCIEWFIAEMAAIYAG
jgi:long-chain-fatty-acid--CoA ligase ACSBG